MTGNISLIMKATSNCTLACSYCQYMSDRTGDNSNLVMSREILHKSISQLMSLASKNVTFIWHGGEPLLAGKDFFEEAICVQRQYQKGNEKIVNNIQTNATLLNQEWVEFLQRNNFNISVSLDGPNEIHNMHRLYPSGNKSFTSVMQGIRLLIDKNLKFGLLAVLTKDSIKEASQIYNFFVTNGVKSFDFLPCIEVNKYTGEMIGSSITSSEFADFMIQVFDLWIEDDNPDIRIRYLDNILTGLLGGKPTLCKFAGTCSNFLTIDCNGDIYPCDNFVGYGELKFGNILDDNLHNILESGKYKDFSANTKTIKPECLNCEWYQICHGGCPYYSYMRGQNFSRENYFCEARKSIFKYVEKRVKRMIS